MNIHKSCKSTYNLHSETQIPPLNFNRSSINQESLKKGRINYIISDSKKKGFQKIQQIKVSLCKFRGSQQEFKREKSLYRQLVSRNNSMKLFKQENNPALEARPKYKDQKDLEDEDLRFGERNSQNLYDESSSNCNKQIRQRHFKRKNILNKTTANDYINSKKNKLIIKESINKTTNSKDQTIETTNPYHLEDLQIKQSENSLREQIAAQQKIIQQKNNEISKLKINIHQLNTQINQMNEYMMERSEQNKKIKSQYDILRHEFSKIINDLHPHKKTVNRYGQDTLIQNQIRHIQDQILNLKNGIKYLQIQNLTLKKVKSQVDMQKKTIYKLQENKKTLENTITLLKDMNNKKANKIKEFMKQKTMKRLKTQVFSSSLLSNDSENSLNISFQDEKIQNCSIKQEISRQNLNLVKVFNSNGKRQMRAYEKVIEV